MTRVNYLVEYPPLSSNGVKHLRQMIKDSLAIYVQNVPNATLENMAEYVDQIMMDHFEFVCDQEYLNTNSIAISKGRDQLKEEGTGLSNSEVIYVLRSRGFAWNNMNRVWYRMIKKMYYPHN